MLTTKYVRDHIDEIRGSLEKRKSDYPIGELLELDASTRKIMTELQGLQAERNKATLAVSGKKKRGENSDRDIEALRAVKEMIEKMEKELPKRQERIDDLLWNMPNVLHGTVPYGEDEKHNRVLRSWGEATNKSTVGHEELLGKLGLIDMERAAKIAGARFYCIKGDLALLEQSLLRFALDLLAKNGYTIISPPYMLRKRYYRGVTALGDFEELLYRVADPKEAEAKKDYEKIGDELFLISTSEHAIAAMHAEEVFAGGQLPLRYAGVSPCFRREAGAHGKDTKGIFRVHQFNKVEQFIFSRQEDSWKHFDELMGNAEEIFQKLKLPYHILDICTGDIGAVAARKQDIEAWVPSQGAYREMGSCSNCTDWQSLRLDIKYDEKGERKYAHTLNSTAVATTRTLVAIAENYANGDGTITVPDVLVPYMGKDRIGK